MLIPNRVIAQKIQPAINFRLKPANHILRMQFYHLKKLAFKIE